MQRDPEHSLIRASCTWAALAVLKKKMTKAKRAAAQEGVSAFEVELIQRRASVLTDAPQDKDLRSRRRAKDRLPCLENLRLFWRFEPFREGFIFFPTTLCLALTRLTISSENLLLVKSRGIRKRHFAPQRAPSPESSPISLQGSSKAKKKK